jgi:peptide/nickel transport system substrate-binding protein
MIGPPLEDHCRGGLRMRALRLLLTFALALGLAVPAAAQDRARAKEVIVAFAAEPRSLLPNTIVDWTTSNQLEHIYDRLVDRDGKTFKPIPALATGWRIVNDTTWEFTLRQGVKFHNGEPFNAQSVQATMDYIKDPAHKSHYLPRWALIKDVQVVNDWTVRFVTEKPWPGLIDRMAGADFLPMPPGALKEQGVQALAARPVGTGPFKFVQWVRDERLVLERDPDYWQGAPDLNRVTFRYIPEFSARLAALLAGEVDIM